MQNRSLIVMVLISLTMSSAFALDSTSIVQNVVSNFLSTTYNSVVSVLSSVVTIFLTPFAWFFVSKVVFRKGSNDGRIVSTISSRKDAKDRLLSHGIGDKELNTRSYRRERDSIKFRKRFSTFEDWQNSSDYRKKRSYF